MKNFIAIFAGLNVYLYGFITFLVILIVLFLFWRNLRRTALGEDKLIDLFFVAGLVGLIVARLFFVFSNFSFFLENPFRTILVFTYPGFSEFGFWLAYFSTWLIYAFKQKINFREIVKILIQPILLGKTLFVGLSLLYSHQLYLIIGLVFLTLSLLVFYLVMRKIREEVLPVIALFYYFVTILAFNNFVLDFWQKDRVYFPGQAIISINQILYLLTFTVSTAWWFIRLLRGRKLNKASN